MKRPVFSKSIPEIDTPKQLSSISSSVSKWIPLICAGAAAGISIIALQEIKNVRKDIILLKKEQNGSLLNEEINKRMENMEIQLKMLGDFIKNKNKVSKESAVIKNAVSESLDNIQIINGEEYEEVEVTDDEEETELESS